MSHSHEHVLAFFNRLEAGLKKAEEIRKFKSDPNYIARHKARARKRKGQRGTTK